MSKPRVSAKKKAELAWLREALFSPEENKLPEPIADPMRVAWAWKGLPWTYHLNNGTSSTYWVWSSPGSKAYLLAVAYLNEQGIPATPRSVTDLMKGPCYQVVSKHLRWMVQGAPWWGPNRRKDMEKFYPLARVKYGRTHAYFVAEPKP